MSDQQTEPQKELTPEEIKAYKKQMENRYDEEIPFLEKQVQYEELHARIDEARLRQHTAMLRLIQLQNPPMPKEEGAKNPPKQD